MLKITLTVNKDFVGVTPLLNVLTSFTRVARVLVSNTAKGKAFRRDAEL